MRRGRGNSGRAGRNWKHSRRGDYGRYGRCRVGSLSCLGKERTSHRLLAKTARDLGFLVDHDAAANTYVTMAGRDRTRPSVIIGSHLDSVWDGGNFDGAAGIVAGLIAINALKGNGFEPRCDMHIERGPVLEAEKLSRLDRHRDTWQLAASRRAHHRQIRPLWRRAARLSSRQRRCRR
ncbi:MAG: hypothetical protein WAN75_45300 [Xanthobacteraceae bacterium]